MPLPGVSWAARPIYVALLKTAAGFTLNSSGLYPKSANLFLPQTSPTVLVVAVHLPVVVLVCVDCEKPCRSGLSAFWATVHGLIHLDPASYYLPFPWSQQWALTCANAP